jgi:lysine-specific demethylase 8
MKLWPSLDYWRETVGEDVFAKVEIGGSYGSDEMERAEIPMQGYLQYLELFEERHGRTGSTTNTTTTIPTTEELVYLSQNDLFPSLYKDVNIPDFCSNEDDDQKSVGHGRLYNVMLWLGPRGCVSPLHYDPLDNCLMQYVGRKNVYLYAPGTHLYAGHEGQQSNTSPINPEDDDEMNKERYPLFYQQEQEVVAFDCVLTPGDLLYVPSKWWHFVRSLETSASVNVWWR